MINFLIIFIFGYFNIINFQNFSTTVNLVEYTAKVENNCVKLEWLTSLEINCYYYYVEKSTNLNKFKTLQKVYCIKDSNLLNKYEILDLKPEKGINYYNLKCVDFVGNIYDLGTIAVIIKYEIHDKINIYDNNGKYIGNSLNVNLTPGLYTIEKIFLNGNVETTKIIIK